MCDLPHITEDTQPLDLLPDESMFLINMFDPWYGDLILYLHTQIFRPNATQDEHRHILHHAKSYIIINDTLYHHGIDAILWHWLTHEEAEIVLNVCYSRACGGHLSGRPTIQNILHAGYFCSSIFKDCMEAVKKFPPCQLFQSKKRTHLDPLHPIINFGPFAKWGIDFMNCKPTFAGVHGYIIVDVD